MKAPLKVAAVQMVSAASLNQNLDAAARLIAQAAQEGAQLVGLPEYFCLFGHKETDKLDIAEQPGTGPIQTFLSDTAHEHNIWLSCGSMPLVSSDPARVLNTQLIFDPTGKQIARYDTICRVDTPEINLGLSICYDLRFPELYRALGEVDLILVPSAFTYTTGKAHWETLLKARAIENQCYVLAPAQGGTHENGRRTWGHSILIDPWGEVLSVLPEHEGVVSGTIDPVRLAEVRQSLPALAHRKLFT
jgi:nitrilase